MHSSHFSKLLFVPARLAGDHITNAIHRSLRQDFELGITVDDVFLVKRFFAIRLSFLGRKLYIRQRCISTAVVCVHIEAS